MIRFDAPAARVAAQGDVRANTFETQVVLVTHESRRVALNGERLGSADRLRHELPTLVFTPDRLAVVKGAPATRRAYLDRALGRLIPARATLGNDYAAVVGQRNAGLRRIRHGDSSRDALAPWSERVAALGADLVRARAETVSLLADRFAAVAEELGVVGATVSYEGDVPTLEQLTARLDADLERGITGIGPHLHDLRIAAAGRDLRVFGSQGEQRIAVLALVLAEAETLRDRIGGSPLVLLDDVLSELDGDRRRALGVLLGRGSQTVLTATSASSLPVEPAQALTVTPGTAR